MKNLDKLPRKIKYNDKEYELFIQKQISFGREVWDITYATPKYFSSDSDIPADELLYGFTGGDDGLDATAKSVLIRLEQKKFIK